MHKQYWFAGNCPNCGQEDEYEQYKGARKASSKWGHDYACCSEKCGLEYAEKLKLSKKPQEIADLKSRIYDLEHDLRVGRL